MTRILVHDLELALSLESPIAFALELSTRISRSAQISTLAKISAAEAKDIPLISQVELVKAGVVRLMELQEQGWSYLLPR